MRSTEETHRGKIRVFQGATFLLCGNVFHIKVEWVTSRWITWSGKEVRINQKMCDKSVQIARGHRMCDLNNSSLKESLLLHNKWSGYTIKLTYSLGEPRAVRAVKQFQADAWPTVASSDNVYLVQAVAWRAMLLQVENRMRNVHTYIQFIHWVKKETKEENEGMPCA